jgi:hypothetical protein
LCMRMKKLTAFLEIESAIRAVSQSSLLQGAVRRPHWAAVS